MHFRPENTGFYAISIGGPQAGTRIRGNFLRHNQESLVLPVSVSEGVRILNPTQRECLDLSLNVSYFRVKAAEPKGFGPPAQPDGGSVRRSSSFSRSSNLGVLTIPH